MDETMATKSDQLLAALHAVCLRGGCVNVGAVDALNPESGYQATVYVPSSRHPLGVREYFKGGATPTDALTAAFRFAGFEVAS